MYDGPAICGIPIEASRGFLKGWYAQNGISLKNPNQITYRIRCSASWNLFKSEVVQERLTIKQINLNRWQIEMNQLNTGSELMKGESELR
jgi:hypothetical protein